MGEIPQGTDTFRSQANGAWVEGVPLNGCKLATNNAVQRGRIAFDINALHKDARPTFHDEIDVERAGFVIAGDTGRHANKVETLLQGQQFEPFDGRINRLGRIGFTLANANFVLELIRVHVGQIRRRRQRTKTELLPLLNAKRQKETVPLGA